MFDELVAAYDVVAPAVRRHGRTYPVAIDPLDTLALEVTEGGTEVPERAWELGAAHLAAVRAAHPDLHDGRLLALWHARGTTLTLRPGGYFGMLATCDALRAEGDGQLRALLHAVAGDDPVRRGRGRVAAVGVTTVLTVPAGNRRAFIAGRRRTTLPTDAGLWHLAPSGMLEASGADALWACVAAELRGELGVSAAPADLAARARVLGLAYDLTRLRPEICLRLDLDAAAAEPVRAALANVEANEEFDTIRLVDTTPGGLDAFWSGHGPAVLTPAAAGAVALLERTLP